MARDKKDKTPKRRLFWRFPGVFLLLFAALSGTALNFYFFFRDGPLGEQATIIIPEGASLRRVTTLLDDRGIIDFSPSFYWTGRLAGLAKDLKAGEYAIPARASQKEVLDIIREGKTVLHKITFPEGLTSAQIVDILRADDRLTGGIEDIPPEGVLLPETYLFRRGENRTDILDRMRENQEKFLNALWAEYDFSLPFTTPEEAVILASLVEEETGIPEERPMVAAVFINRLERNMRLQSDPTVIYGLTGGEPLGRPIRQSELEKETPYNTYVIRGLPEGPIANPGKESLEAVFNPADSDALYFVADGSGGHVFAETLEEHNRNVAKWRTIQRQRREEE